MADQPDGILLRLELRAGADSILLPCLNLTERFAILLNGELVDFVLL
jgi:hypothetical protein